jgi:hypothetical protein
MVKVLFVLCAVIAVGMLACVTIRRSYVQTATSGQPFDHLGPRIKCQLCGAPVAVCQSGYNYQCETCGKEFRARWNDESKEIELDW